MPPPLQRFPLEPAKGVCPSLICPNPLEGCWPKFTFSPFTRDPNLHNPHLHKTHIYTTPHLHRIQIYMNPNLHRLIFTKPRFTQTQIYRPSNLHQTQIVTVPNLHRPQFYTTKINLRSATIFFSKGKTTLFWPKAPYLIRGLWDNEDKRHWGRDVEDATLRTFDIEDMRHWGHATLRTNIF